MIFGVTYDVTVIVLQTIALLQNFYELRRDTFTNEFCVTHMM